MPHTDAIFRSAFLSQAHLGFSEGRPPFEMSGVAENGQSARVTFQTRYVDEGYAARVPRELRAIVQGPATLFTLPVRHLTPLDA